MRIDPSVVRPDHFLRFAAPDVICGIEILIGARSEAVEHEELLRTERAAKWGLKRFN